MSQETSQHDNNANHVTGEDPVPRMRIRSRRPADPMAFLFKLKRNRQAIVESQKPESVESSLSSCEDTFLISESEEEVEPLDGNEAQDKQAAEDKDKNSNNDPNGEVVSDLFKKGGPSKLQAQDSNDSTSVSAFAARVIHPWHIVDYHLYLLQIEGKKDLTARRNGVLLRDGVECRSLYYDEMFEDDTFDPDLVGPEPSVLFAALPVPEHHIKFNGAAYVLEYDWNLRTLCARHFAWVPEDLRNVECVWNEGIIIYCVPIVEMIDVMKTALEQRYRRLEFLSTNPRCTTSYVAHDDPGMELVVAYSFCQFAVDFAEALIPEETGEGIEIFKSELEEIMEEIRLTLQRASYRAWFAVREGLSMEKFSHKVHFDRYLNDLFTYNKSVEEGSLRGKKWHAPGLDTCKKIRDNDAMKRRASNERRLKDLFAPFDQDEHKEKQERAFQEMLANVDKSQADALIEKPLQAPLTPLWAELNFDEFETSPGSPVVLHSAPLQDDGLETTEYHHAPLLCLLNNVLDLVQEQPELDTLENRGRFGALLTEMGICVKDTLDLFSIAPQQGFENDNWSLVIHDEANNEDDEELTAPVCRLLPSPIFD
ncbi:uncharacterized protein ACHE_30969S [Aspergillus chevalieri]|uniref:Uncharacterized protein n=1 Tax=Aspergillus chevalieri TaxID=182096 RepID=A0A7R7VLN8_ASPCH|nr:uncharacterized protein ACHE_30969S [Aspergillus chevalieri]BCR86982.1 hypothetical protein ACHE_30969S [Aspergillus chevalieri]